MAGADKLYTPDLLALAVALADYPPDLSLPLHGHARSKSCGSTLALDLAVDWEGRIAALGLQVRACAVGQASAAIFARDAAGRALDDIATAHAALTEWLTGSGELPGWPGLATIAAARAFPARHGAIMLSWTAARDALSSPDAAR